MMMLHNVFDELKRVIEVSQRFLRKLSNTLFV